MSATASSPDFTAGVFTRAQALAAGYSPDRIRWMRESGQWLTVRRGHYITAATSLLAARDPVVAHRVQIDAALAHLQCDVVVSHRSAALLHGFPTISEWPTTVTLTTDRASRRTATGVHIHTTRLPLAHLTTVDGVPTTTSARTLVDLGRCAPYQEVVIIGDAALHRGITSLADVHNVLSDCDRWPGMSRARAAIDALDARSHGPLASLARMVFAEQQLPAPDLNIQVTENADIVGRVDLLWKRERTAGLFTAERPTTRSSSGQARLRQMLLDNGFSVVLISANDVIYRKADLAIRLREAFAQNGASSLKRSA